ncbi:MAG: hypothetical protein LBU06_03065 [Desulfovibrio sp.]|jgi:hypothetical protein|nr:hypothetical protein [Desulfovibrio sp.]
MNYTFPYPTDMREYTVMRRQVFAVSLTMMLPMLGFLFLFVLVFFLGVLIYEKGLNIFNYPEYILQALGVYLGEMAWIPPALALFTAVLTRRRVHLQKVLGMPVLYGFDANCIYFNCAAFESAIRWECFNAWREKRDFFLLHDGTRWAMLPKAVWSETELEIIRGYLRRYATPASLTVQF